MTEDSTALTIAVVRAFLNGLRQFSIPPHRVETRAQARVFTRYEILLFGRRVARRWKVGDDYYILSGPAKPFI